MSNYSNTLTFEKQTKPKKELSTKNYKALSHIPDRDELHKTFAGVLYNYDFEGYTSPVKEASRIRTAKTFNRRLKYKGNGKQKFNKNGYAFTY